MAFVQSIRARDCGTLGFSGTSGKNLVAILVDNGGLDDHVTVVHLTTLGLSLI
jgi:hypothetical protein